MFRTTAGIHRRLKTKLSGNSDHPIFATKRAAALRARLQILQLRLSDHLGTPLHRRVATTAMPVIRHTEEGVCPASQQRRLVGSLFE